MKFFQGHIIIFIEVLFILKVNASVAPNPFLRPGTQQKQPPPETKIFKPKAVPQKDISKELEFRGYFILKDKPYFCLLNKKSNHAEWVSLSEVTYEEFKAHEFNLESEMLTILYEGHSYQLPLAQGGLSIGSSPNNPPSSVKRIPSRVSSSPSLPKYMPPKPKTTPKIPDWIVRNRIPSQTSARNFGDSTSSRNKVPPRVFPGGGSTLSQNFRTFPGSTTPTNIVKSSPSSWTLDSESSASLINPQINETIENDSVMVSSPETESNLIDLDNLPPPPPPPNIVPPTPPPDILPSRDD